MAAPGWKKMFDELYQAVEQHTQGAFDTVSERVAAVEARADELDARAEALLKRIEALEKRLPAEAVE